MNLSKNSGALFCLSVVYASIAGCGTSSDTQNNSAEAPDGNNPTQSTSGGMSGVVPEGGSGGGTTTGGASTSGGATSTGGSTSTGGTINVGGTTQPTCDGSTDDPIPVHTYDSDDGGPRNDSYLDMVKPATDFSSADTLDFQSLPGAPNIVYLNVASYYVFKNSDEDVHQVARLLRHISEGVRPFNVNVTSRQADWNDTPKGNALHVSLNLHYGGGSCPLGQFGHGESQGGQNCQSSADFYSLIHEIGHGFGITHHIAPFENVTGSGTDFLNFRVSLSNNGAYLAQWTIGKDDDGEFFDDIQVISDLLGFRPDDHGGDLAEATALEVTDGSVRPQTNNGVIAQDGDVDVFSFTTTGGDIDLDVRPLRFYNMLTAAADLVDESGNVVIPGVSMFHYDYSTWPLVREGLGDDPKTNVPHGVKLRGCLEEGTYYLRVTNSGYDDGQGNGYTSYSSLGYYDLKGVVPE